MNTPWRSRSKHHPPVKPIRTNAVTPATSGQKLRRISANGSEPLIDMHRITTGDRVRPAAAPSDGLCST
jgi:hypothetical protein